MTQDRKGSARDDDNLDVGSFGLGLADLGELDGDPSEMFGGAKARPAAAPQARAPSAPARTHQPEPDDLPDFGHQGFGDGDFGGPGDFDAGPPSSPAARNAPDPGDWTSLAGLGGSSPRAPAFGNAHDDEGDPDAEFAEAQFGGARSVASLGRVPDEPDPKGRYRQEEPALDDVVTDFAGGDDDYAEPPKPSLYRADPTEDEEEDEGDRSLSLSDADEGEDDEEGEDEEDAVGPSIVDRLKRFAIPVAAAAALGGVGLVGWPHLAPLIGMGGEEYPVQAAAPVVPKQPQQAAAMPAFPPSAQPPQRPALPGGSSLLPAAPGQQAVVVQPGLPSQPALPGSGTPPRQIGFPPVQQQPVTGQLPQVGPGSGMQLPAVMAQPAPPAQGSGIQQVALPPADPRPVAQTPPAAPANVLAGGFNARTAPVGDVEARLASIASDLSTIRSRQEDAARAAQSDRDDFGRRLGVLERRAGEGGKIMTPKPAPVAEEIKPRKTERADRAERAERSVRPARRAAYQQEASADEGVPPLKPKVVQGFSLKGVSRNLATVESRSGVVEVGVGQTIPGAGEVKAIRRYGSDWVVVVGKGVIVQQ